MADTILTVSDYIANVETQGLFLPDQRPRELPRRAETYDQYLAEHYRELVGAPIPTKPTGTLPTVEAFVNSGRWVWECDCGGAQVVEPGEDLICVACGVGGWRTVEFPADRDEIEAELLRQPGHRLNAPVRHWKPGWTLEDLRVRTAKADALIHEGITHPRALSIGATRVWVTGETLTAANMNTYTSNILDDLAGRNGVIDFEDSLSVLDGSAGDRYILLPKGMTAQRPGSPAEGTLRFNTTTDEPEIYTGSAWRTLPTDVGTFLNLQAAGLVGTGADQFAVGDHGHPISVAGTGVADYETTWFVSAGTLWRANTNLSISVAVAQGETVILSAIFRANVGTNTIDIRFLRDGTAIGSVVTQSGLGGGLTQFQFYVGDSPGTGTYTYTLESRHGQATTVTYSTVYLAATTASV